MGDPHRQPVDSTSSPALPELSADANVSVDVDGLDCYRTIHGLSTTGADGDTDPIWTIGVERALDLFSSLGLEATFFVVGRDLEIPPHRRQARRVVDEGHEIANHTLDHLYDLRSLPGSELAHQIEAADQLIADATNVRPVGFRTPGYNVDADVVAFCRRAGHRYDASVFPCVSYWLAKATVMRWRRLRGRPSGSDETDPRSLFAPRQPYFPDPLDCWDPSPTPGRFVEIPVSTFGARSLPLIGTSLHLLDTVGFERIWPLVDRSLPRFLSLEMHAIDFLDATDLADVQDGDRLVDNQPDLRIPWDDKKELYRRVFGLVCDDRSPATLAAATESLGPG